MNQHDSLRKGYEKQPYYSLMDSKHRRQLRKQNNKRCFVSFESPLGDESENRFFESLSKPTTRKLTILNPIPSKKSNVSHDRIRSESAQRRRSKKKNKI